MTPLSLSNEKVEKTKTGFSIVEVVLAIGVISVAIVALLGLLAPTLGSVKNVVDTGQATAAISKFNAWLDQESFGDVFDAVLAEQAYFVYDSLNANNEIIETIVDSSAPSRADVSGPVFRFMLSQSPILEVSGTADTWGEAYFPIYIEVLLEEADSIPNSASADHIARYRILSYTTAKLR